ncbi:MAG: DUF2726 domain-containing protein [Pirellulaceae bacterium]|jgi:very-short-patch-repair endonuclease|nr:DUF2726 domain-containing protein [Pirellulaceae bacterium]
MNDLLLHPGVILGVLGVLGAICVVALLRLREPPPPYEKRDSLLTHSELKFYGVLQEANKGLTICSMVRIADLIRVRQQAPKQQAWRNRILAKHIDFVLCDPETMEARLAIELDDRSHERPDRVERDRFVNSALSAAGLPLLRVPVRDEYDARELRKSIRKQLEA